MSVQPGAVIVVDVERPAAGGRMIARVEGQVVLVAGAIPGERVAARIERVGRGVAYAATASVEQPSADRRAAGDLACGGSLYAHIAYSRQLALKSLVIGDAFARIGRLEMPSPVPVAASREDGYRMRARLHRRGRAMGFFREGTHVLCEARATGQLLPTTCDALDRVNAMLGSLAFDAARELDVSENVSASERAVHVELDRERIDLRPLRAAALPDGITGLTAGHAAIAGSPYVTDTIAVGSERLSLRRHARAFFQGNRYLLENLVGHVVKAAGGGRLLDLYAGVGLFAIAAATASGARVVAVEGDRFAARDLDVNARASGAAIETVHGPVERFAASSRERPDAAIVDPPRTGMTREALDGVIALRPARIVYVSCGVATLARDARRLVDAGWRLARADAFDLFPNTPHVETVAVFER